MLMLCGGKFDLTVGAATHVVNSVTQHVSFGHCILIKRISVIQMFNQANAFIFPRPCGPVVFVYTMFKRIGPGFTNVKFAILKF